MGQLVDLIINVILSATFLTALVGVVVGAWGVFTGRDVEDDAR